MYLYYNTNGDLKERINDKAIRTYDQNTNTIYCYWDGFVSTNTYTTSIKYYKVVDGVETQIGSTLYGTKVVDQQIPSANYKERDLYYFEYFTNYTFYKFVVPTTITQSAGTYRFVIEYTWTDSDDKTQNLTMGWDAFKVDGTSGFVADENISLAEFNELKALLSTTGTVYTAGDGINISSGVISVDTTEIQEKLTAGTNITISNNVISATGSGGTYTAGYGIDITNNEIKVIDGEGLDIDSDNSLIVDTDVIASVDYVDDSVSTKASQSDLNALTTRVSTAESDIDSIEAKIPAQATSSNQLADKAFVNSSVATATGTFKGTLDVVSDLGLSYGATTTAVASALDSHTFTPVAVANDYCFVINKDTNSNTVYQRFKYSTSWGYEYELNNSSFTAVQWASINSGATSTNIGQIANKLDKATPTASQGNKEYLYTFAGTTQYTDVALINDMSSSVASYTDKMVATALSVATELATKQDLVNVESSNGTTTVSDSNIVLEQDDYTITLDQGGAYFHQTGSSYSSTDHLALLGDITVEAYTGENYTIRRLTQAQYDALATKDADTIYIIVG